MKFVLRIDLHLIMHGLIFCVECYIHGLYQLEWRAREAEAVYLNNAIWGQKLEENRIRRKMSTTNKENGNLILILTSNSLFFTTAPHHMPAFSGYLCAFLGFQTIPRIFSPLLLLINLCAFAIVYPEIDIK